MSGDAERPNQFQSLTKNIPFSFFQTLLREQWLSYVWRRHRGWLEDMRNKTVVSSLYTCLFAINSLHYFLLLIFFLFFFVVLSSSLYISCLFAIHPLHYFLLLMFFSIFFIYFLFVCHPSLALFLVNDVFFFHLAIRINHWMIASLLGEKKNKRRNRLHYWIFLDLADDAIFRDFLYVWWS